MRTRVAQTIESSHDKLSSRPLAWLMLLRDLSSPHSSVFCPSKRARARLRDCEIERTVDMATTSALRSLSASTASSSGSHCKPSVAAAAAQAHKPAAAPGSLVSRFYGARLAVKCEVGAGVSKKVKCSAGNAFATATVDTSVKPYTLPTWADFEMGYYPVYWETATGRPPTSGQLLTIFFNAASSKLKPNVDFGIAFNGGFNQPIMCGGEPRVMSKKERGSLCEPFYSIKINVPLHAMSLEFSFTDGVNWDGPYKLIMEVPDKLKGLPQSYFNERLGKDLAEDGACESAIYPEAVFIQDRCTFPAGMIQQGGDRCDLDIVPGCTDPESPYFDPLANVDDGSCPFDP